jgi:hypothetical protein
MRTIKEQYAELIRLVEANDYYSHKFMVHRVPLDSSDREIVVACHDFWESLPDSSNIRREPFFLLCDICENIFDE